MSVQRLWKCYACSASGHDFQAAQPVCPNCGHDGSDPKDRMAHLIAPRVVLHFNPPKKWPLMIGTGLTACTKQKVGTAGIRATGEVAVVNCPACQATKEYKEVSGGLAVPNEYAVPDIADTTKEG